MNGMKRVILGVVGILAPALALAGGIPTFVQEHARWRNDDGSETSATWKQNVDVAHAGQVRGENIRLRFCVANTSTSYSGSLYVRLQYAENTAGPWTDAGTDGSGLAAFEMTTTTGYADGAASTSQITGSGSWSAGRVVEHPSNTAPLTTLAVSAYSNFEFCFQATAKALGSKVYYFRASNNGANLNTYSRYAQLTMAAGEANEPPVIVSALTASASTEVAFTYAIQASGSEPITYGATGLPAGLTFADGTISGTATTAGAYDVTLTAANSYGSDTETLALDVVANLPPVANDQNTTSVIQGGEAQINLSWSDVDTPLLTDHTFTIVSQPSHGALESYNQRYNRTSNPNIYYYQRFQICCQSESRGGAMRKVCGGSAPGGARYVWRTGF